MPWIALASLTHRHTRSFPLLIFFIAQNCKRWRALLLFLGPFFLSTTIQYGSMMNGKFVGCYKIVKFVRFFSLFLLFSNANTDMVEKTHSRTNAVINGKNMCVYSYAAHTIFFLVIFNELNVLKMADECDHLGDRPFFYF